MLVLLAQEAGAAAQPQPTLFGALLQMLPMLLLIGGVWWFLVIGPQKKAAKAHREKLDAIQKGDKVRTRGGIEGVVVRVQDDRVILKIDTEGKVHVPFAKSYIEDVVTEEPAPVTKETK